MPLKNQPKKTTIDDIIFDKLEVKLFKMKTLEEIKQILRQSKPLLEEHYRITQLGIFGSYARGEQTEESDVDLLIDYDQAPTLFKLIELRDYLSSAIGMKVDVVTQNGLKPRILNRVLSEIVYV
ncbi:nucleotidyltransferase family protein [Iningainema tapete]|nr:nucleotidyltransferase family protein [Iningainema tapete]